MKNNNANNKTPNITLSVFKNDKPKDNYMKLLVLLKDVYISIIKNSLREAVQKHQEPSKELLNISFNDEFLKVIPIKIKEFLDNNPNIKRSDVESYDLEFKDDLKEWITSGEALTEIFLSLLLDNEQGK